MALDNTERLYLERQVTLARAVIAGLSLVALLETSQAPVRRSSVVILSAYLVVALGAALAERLLGEVRFRIPLAVDFAVLAAFAYFTPSVTAFWFLFLFAVFALATRGNERAMLALVGFATVGIIIRVAREEAFQWQGIWHWVAIGFGTIVSGLGMGYLAAREREYLGRQQFLEKITGVVRFDRGLTESIRQALGELTLAFECEQACLAIRDDDVERLFVWKVSTSDGEAKPPETLPLARIETLSIQSVSGASRGTCEVACAAKADDKNHPGFARASCLPRCAGSNCRDSTQPVLPQQAPPARASQGHRVAKYKTNPL